jgi:hypothetical protein
VHRFSGQLDSVAYELHAEPWQIVVANIPVNPVTVRVQKTAGTARPHTVSL